MKNTLILHGWGGDSNENWLPWLKLELEKKGINVFIPNLSDTNNPNLKNQLNDLISFDNNHFIVGHSLGCQLVMKFIEEKSIKNSKIVLVAPTYPNLAKELGKNLLGDSYNSIEKYYNTELNFKKINSLNNDFIIFLSGNDPYINLENAKKYYSNLTNIKFIEFKNKGHFNKNAGVLELPEILEYLK